MQINEKGSIFSILTHKQKTEIIENNRKQQFLAACQWPLSWKTCARRHKMSADILYHVSYAAYLRSRKKDLKKLENIFKKSKTKVHSYQLIGQELIDFRHMQLLSDYFLLSGYAIECVLKGYLLAQIPELVNNEKRLDRLVTTHDLCQLSREASFKISPEEEKLLALISRHIIWGKYPAPIDIKDMPSSIGSDDKSLAIDNPFHENRVKRIVDSVFERGFDLLNQED
ncbi:hypothetical protein QQ054_19325 [Oscillatoria amoena NRMC-F 0135]|nr:hypothetical protein [Oscillatoria laete-virens]MDL5048170.1 hypothetical protein [Oscillatoria amoena NRMC-F 0135]MDL5053062.1 hypothetical protein [Oscillatoria laete-virens NRMC-F 0139]